MSLEKLARYESAAVAAMNAGKENDLAVAAMADYYKGVYGEDFDDDVMLQRSLKEAAVGGDKGITNSDIFMNIKVYNGKYEKAFASTKFSDLTNYLLEKYLPEERIPEGFKEDSERYKNFTISDLLKKAKEEETPKEEKEKIGKYLKVVEMLKSRRLRAKTLGIANEMTEEGMNVLYPKKSEEEKGDKE